MVKTTDNQTLAWTVSTSISVVPVWATTLLSPAK